MRGLSVMLVNVLFIFSFGSHYLGSENSRFGCETATVNPIVDNVRCEEQKENL